MPIAKKISKKGMELPINTLIIIAIAIIVILAVVVFFMGGFVGASKSIQDRQAFLDSCAFWTQMGCTGTAPSDVETTFHKWQPNVNLNGDNIGGTGLSKNDYLKKACGCLIT